LRVHNAESMSSGQNGLSICMYRASRLISTDTCIQPHFEPIIRPWTDVSLGQCSYLNMCYGEVRSLPLPQRFSSSPSFISLYSHKTPLWQTQTNLVPLRSLVHRQATTHRRRSNAGTYIIDLYRLFLSRRLRTFRKRREVRFRGWMRRRNRGYLG
jgi:hypothetical protein